MSHMPWNPFRAGLDSGGVSFEEDGEISTGVDSTLSIPVALLVRQLIGIGIDRAMRRQP